MVLKSSLRLHTGTCKVCPVMHRDITLSRHQLPHCPLIILPHIVRSGSPAVINSNAKPRYSHSSLSSQPAPSGQVVATSPVGEHDGTAVPQRQKLVLPPSAGLVLVSYPFRKRVIMNDALLHLRLYAEVVRRTVCRCCTSALRFRPRSLAPDVPNDAAQSRGSSAVLPRYLMSSAAPGVRIRLVNLTTQNKTSASP